MTRHLPKWYIARSEIREFPNAALVHKSYDVMGQPQKAVMAIAATVVTASVPVRTVFEQFGIKCQEFILTIKQPSDITYLH